MCIIKNSLSTALLPCMQVDSARSDLRSQKEEILKLQEEVVKIHNIKDNLMCELVDLENRKRDMENGQTWHTKDAVGLQQPLSHDAETNEKSISFASQYTQVSEVTVHTMSLFTKCQ